MALGVQVFLHLYTWRNNAVQALNLILNTAQESFLSFQLLTMACSFMPSFFSIAHHVHAIGSQKNDYL